MQCVASSPTGILVTSFDQMRLQRDLLLDVPWGYAVLDEGHKIRNPDAEVCLPALPCHLPLAGPACRKLTQHLLPSPYPIMWVTH